jgi:hypothetical protein
MGVHFCLHQRHALINRRQKYCAGRKGTHISLLESSEKDCFSGGQDTVRRVSETHAYQSKVLMCVTDGKAVIQYLSDILSNFNSF